MAQVRVTYPSLSKAEVVQRLRRATASLERKLPISRIILFGSYATGRHTAGSDIDILVVYKGRERKDAYKIIMSEVELPRIELRIYTEEQFDDLMANSPKFAEALDKEGILIAGAKEE